MESRPATSVAHSDRLISFLRQRPRRDALFWGARLARELLAVHAMRSAFVVLGIWMFRLATGCGPVSGGFGGTGGNGGGGAPAGNGAGGLAGANGGAGGTTGPACGPVQCDVGMVCCNAACGICTPPGGACVAGC